jgi:predicted transcriptional regulator
MTPVLEEETMHHEKEIVEFDAPLNEVIHLLVLGNLMFLYVRKDAHIIGIIRLSDVLQMVVECMKHAS